MLQETRAVGSLQVVSQDKPEARPEDFEDLLSSADKLLQSVAQLPLQNAPQVPVLKDAEKALDKERWKELREKTINSTASIAGKIKQFEVFNTLHSLSSAVGERVASQPLPAWSECAELNEGAEKIIEDLEQMQTILTDQVKFWKEESLATHQLWNGGQDLNLRWRVAAMVSKTRHGISYHYTKLQQNVQKQWQALQVQENDVACARYQLQSQKKITQLLKHMEGLGSLVERMQTYQKNLQAQQKKIEGFNILEEDLRLINKEIEEFPKDLKAQLKELTDNQKEIASSTCFFLQDPKLKTDKATLKNFEEHFNAMNRLLGQFANLREKLNVLSNIYYYQPYPQEAHIDHEKEQANFEDLKKEKEKLPPLSLEAYSSYPMQVSSLKSKQTAIALLMSQVQANLDDLKKQSTPPVEDQGHALSVFTANSFIDARSEMRQKATTLMEKIVVLNEELKTSISRKESFVGLYFRFEPLQDEIDSFEKEKTPYLKSLEDNLKEIQNRLSSVMELTQRLKSALKGLNVYKPPAVEKKEEVELEVEEKK